MSLGVIQCHWNYFVVLRFKVAWFVKAVEQTVQTDDHLWNGYLSKLNHMALIPGSNKSSIVPLGFLSYPIALKVGSAIRKIDLRELTCQYPSHIKPGAK